MNVYLDSSVVLRVILKEANSVAIWKKIESAISSELLRLECLRTIDRARIRGRLTDEAFASQRSFVLELLGNIQLVPLTTEILETAAGPFPTYLGALDAIHFATALLARQEFDDLMLATHDHELGLAANAHGFTVHGVG